MLIIKKKKGLFKKKKGLSLVEFTIASGLLIVVSTIGMAAFTKSLKVQNEAYYKATMGQEVNVIYNRLSKIIRSADVENQVCMKGGKDHSCTLRGIENKAGDFCYSGHCPGIQVTTIDENGERKGYSFLFDDDGSLLSKYNNNKWESINLSNFYIIKGTGRFEIMDVNQFVDRRDVYVDGVPYVILNYKAMYNKHPENENEDNECQGCLEKTAVNISMRITIRSVERIK